MNESRNEMRQVNEQCVSAEDWNQNCLMIGLEGPRRAIPSGPGGPSGPGVIGSLVPAPTPWEGASVSDLRILANLLLKPLTLVTPQGVTKHTPVAQESPFLRKLGVWAAGVSQWAEAHRK